MTRRNSYTRGTGEEEREKINLDDGHLEYLSARWIVGGACGRKNSTTRACWVQPPNLMGEAWGGRTLASRWKMGLASGTPMENEVVPGMM